MTRTTISLILEPDYDDGAGSRTARFEWAPAASGKGSVEDSIRSGYLVEGAASTALSLLSRITGGSNTQSVSIAGGNQHAITFEFQTPQNTPKDDGSLYQWGTSSNPNDGPNYHTATGGSKEQQQFVLINAIRHAATDSISPARLEAFEYSASGVARKDHLDVFLESPTTNIVNDEPARADCSLTVVETVDLEQSADKQQKRP